MIRLALSLLSAAALAVPMLAVPVAGPLAAQTRTDAEFVVKLYGANLARIRLTGETSASGYEVSGTLSTTGIASALSNTSYDGTAKGRRSGLTFRPARYDELVVERDKRKDGALVYASGVPQPVGYKAEERMDDALDVATQGDTVDPLTAIFMVLRDQPADEVCPPVRQYVFDGERRSVVELTRTSQSAEEIVCAGQFKRVKGYPKDEYDNKRKVFPIEVTYRRAGDVMQVQTMSLQTDYGLGHLERR